ncbi:MAG: ABC transporter ATP-binding protein [Bacteroidetes bacterium]|nr:MAG: ABC transporter ATP-binding protein [Bacteroidota bacterium]
MNITLEKLIPLPLLEQDTSGSEVWEAESLLFIQGKRYVVEAPSGRGKTSLLSILYGLRNDYRGRVLYDGKNGAEFSTAEWAAIRKTHLSFIFQGLELFEQLSALDNIRLKNELTAHCSLDEILEMAEILGIAPFLNRKAGILSFGQQQRVAILRALCQPFDFLFADECFSHIDTDTSSTALKLILEACEQRGAGLILTSLNKASVSEDLIRLAL